MFQDLQVFRLSAALAQHAGQRQALVARNVAHADTPGYVARDVPPFADVIAQFGKGAAPSQIRAVEVGSGASPNGNQVSLEQEMLKSVEAKRQHDRAMAIYKSGLAVLRSTLRAN